MKVSRREFTQQAACAASLIACRPLGAQSQELVGVVSGEPTAEKAGREIFAAGGNVVDAVVAAAFVAAVCVPHQTGLGGYGGHMTLAVEVEDRKSKVESQGGGTRRKGARDQDQEQEQDRGRRSARRVVCIDFNSMAPAAARGDMFSPDAEGKVAGQRNMYGWLAAGVPGILAGLELAQKTYGTKPLGDVMQPAIRVAREGFPFGPAAVALRGAARHLAADPASAKLYFKDGQPLTAGDHFANPEAARLLERLATDNSVEAFYRGEIAEQVAAAFANHGGLVTKGDMAAYKAREVEPLVMSWDDWTIHTAPLTAGGATVLESLLLLKELKWADREPLAADTLQLQVEAFRQAWQDRLELLGDPEHADVPLARLLDAGTIKNVAARIEKAVAEKQPLPVRVTTRPDQGTIHLSAADKQGNLAALTLTHGGSFGARVTVPGLGLTLGHGMSRFDPHAGHPNAPGPHKRPLHNMCPTIASKNGLPMFAVGGRGGRKIPNAVGEVVLQLVAREKHLKDAVAAPRMHTEGTLAVSFERSWPEAQIEELKRRGYTLTTAASATVSAVGLTDRVAEFVSAMR